jgi:hypothetical protein
MAIPGRPAVGTREMTPGGGAGSQGPVELSKNGLVRNRYIDVTGQVRRVSVAMVLIIDQAHIQDVLTSFANSRDPLLTVTNPPDVKLRTQTTQFHWQRMPDTFKLVDQSENRPEPGTVPSGPGGPRRDPRMMPTPVAPSATTTAAGSSNEEEKSNLIEMTVYGIVSLYERFTEPATASTAGPGGTGAPVTRPGVRPGLPTPPGGVAPAPAPVPPTPVKP